MPPEMRKVPVFSKNGKREEATSGGGWLDGYALRSPIGKIDLFLVIARWFAILAIGVMSLFKGFQGVQLLPMAVAWPAIVAYNLPISIFALRRRPLESGRVGWLLFGDIVQSTLAVTFTGGYRSFYFVLFLLTTVEVALAFPWKLALVLAVAGDALQVGAMAVYRVQSWEPLAEYIVVGKFIISLLMGGMAILFSELLRREAAVGQEASRAVVRAAALNDVFVHLGQTSLDLERTLEVILASADVLPDVAFSLVLLPEPDGNSWRIGASNSERHPIAERVAGLAWDGSDLSFFSAAPGADHRLPQFLAGDGIKRMAGVCLRTPCGECLGILMVARNTDQLLSDNEQVFLRSLALEAGLTVRNARLYGAEIEHVARLERFEALQSTFFSAIGHELKTPLTILKMLIPSLHQWSELPADTRSEISQTIDQNLHRLETLITDLLESARLEAGALTLHIRPTDLARLTRRVLDELAPLLSRKNQRVALQMEQNLPEVQADSRRVEQILSNLLNNAAKFAPATSTIDVGLTLADAAVQICVANAGPSVPLPERERIFDKFYTAATNQALAGTGLGLYICRELVHLHGGRIWVEDRPGGGSRFCFTLPPAREETADAEGE